jgi:DNA-binding MarR family transcriptional regulator
MIDLNKRRAKNQEIQVLQYLKEHDGITPLQATLVLKRMRLSEIIRRLKLEGNNITTVIVSENGVRFARYVLEKAK